MVNCLILSLFRLVEKNEEDTRSSRKGLLLLLLLPLALVDLLGYLSHEHLGKRPKNSQLGLSAKPMRINRLEVKSYRCHVVHAYIRSS